MSPDKFRVWDKEAKVFKFYYFGTMYSVNEEQYSDSMLFTGKTDKENNEIYELDILDCYKRGDDKNDERRICTVEWNERKAGFEIITHKCDARRAYGWSSSAVDFHTFTTMCDIKLIGNKYENPELIDKK